VSYCFDGEGQVRSLASLFVEGFDYKGVIHKAFETALQRYDATSLPSFDDLWEDLQFIVGTTGLNLRTRPVAQGSYDQPISFWVTFEEFGCLNMTLFR